MTQKRPRRRRNVEKSKVYVISIGKSTRVRNFKLVLYIYTQSSKWCVSRCAVYIALAEASRNSSSAEPSSAGPVDSWARSSYSYIHFFLFGSVYTISIYILMLIVYIYNPVLIVFEFSTSCGELKERAQSNLEVIHGLSYVSKQESSSTRCTKKTHLFREKYRHTHIYRSSHTYTILLYRTTTDALADRTHTHTLCMYMRALLKRPVRKSSQYVYT